MGSSIKTTMKLLNVLLVIALFFTTIYAVPLQKASLVEEECEEEPTALDYEPALGVPDLVIDTSDNAPVANNEEDCEDDIVTEEPEAQAAEATSECAEEEIVEELPEVFEMALPDSDLVIEEECEE